MSSSKMETCLKVFLSLELEEIDDEFLFEILKSLDDCHSCIKKWMYLFVSDIFQMYNRYYFPGNSGQKALESISDFSLVK